MNYNKSILGGAIAFIVAMSCCWLPVLIVLIGGGSTLIALSDRVEHFSGLFMGIGAVLIGFGGYQYFIGRKSSDPMDAILLSTITCPSCGHHQEETMPTNACQYFYECMECKTILKPKEGDCCVYCSYGTMACPPIQLGEDCC